MVSFLPFPSPLYPPFGTFVPDPCHNIPFPLLAVTIYSDSSIPFQCVLPMTLKWDVSQQQSIIPEKCSCQNYVSIVPFWPFSSFFLPRPQLPLQVLHWKIYSRYKFTSTPIRTPMVPVSFYQQDYGTSPVLPCFGTCSLSVQRISPSKTFLFTRLFLTNRQVLLVRYTWTIVNKNKDVIDLRKCTLLWLLNNTQYENILKRGRVLTRQSIFFCSPFYMIYRDYGHSLFNTQPLQNFK